MLHQLAIENVGPAALMKLDFGSRVNVLTGDNGLGKSFLLDVIWWTMTHKWPSEMAYPDKRASQPAKISAELCYGEVPVRIGGTYSRGLQDWLWGPPPPARLLYPQSLGLYAQVDGGFTLWDPLRDHERRAPRMLADSDGLSFRFTPESVWDGVDQNGSTFSNGLIRDVVKWQLESGEAFKQFCDVLRHLSPDENETLIPGKPTRVSLHDVRDVPTFRTGYGQDVPVVHLSAGVKRILSLAYLLVWLWQEHLRACEFLGQKPATEIVFLIDEIECHLHPRWQRVILNALLNVMTAMTGTDAVNVQLICVTHSPLILASLEPFFNEETDRLFHIYQKDREVLVEDVPWTCQGDVTNWLVSDIFGLKQARSREAERAIEAAEAFMRGDTQSLPQDLNSQELIHQELVRTLPGHDDFWPRWIVSTKQVAGAIP